MYSLRVGTSLVCALAALLAAAPADASHKSDKKAIWGPARVDGVSQFPIYRDLGVGVWQTALSWADVARSRPASPRDPDDPAYTWPEELDFALREARRHRIKVMINLTQAPGWANGGRPSHWAPRDPSDYADFAAAAARRYPHVRHWMVWGEPSRAGNFAPLEPGRAAPRRYAELLDAAYEALKRVNLGNLVIGGNTWTAGVVSPTDWLRDMRLPDGSRPRLDLYGHNPFTRRKPRLADDPLVEGAVDFGSLDEFADELDRAYPGRRLKLFLSEFTVPTDHATGIFNFHESQETAADWLAAAFAEAGDWDRIYALGWFKLYDDPPAANGDEPRFGLLDHRGRPKPAYRAYRDG